MTATVPVAITAPPSRWRVRRGSTQTVACGASTEGDRWALQVRRSPRGVRTQLQILTAQGYACPPVAVASLPLQLGRALSVFGGRDAGGPAWLLLRLSPQVHAVRVRVSDGTWHDLAPVDDGSRSSARVAVLVYPRHLDVHRIDPYGVDGACLDDVV